MKNILIIGGAGYIGGVTAHLAEEAGHRVTVLDNLTSGKKSNLSDSMDFIEGDVTDKRFIDRVFAENHFDIVMHFAAKILVSESMVQPYDYLQTNSFGVLNAVDGAVNKGVKAYILSSTAATYGMPERFPIEEDTPPSPINPYGASKLIAENILRSYESSHNLKWAALRYFNVAGAYGKVGPDYPFVSHIIPMLLDKLKKHEPISIFGTDYNTPDGTCIRDYVHVVDIARAHIMAAEKIVMGRSINCPINLGSSEGFSVEEVVTKFDEVTGADLVIKYEDRRPGDPDKLVASNERAKKLLGWRPQFGLEKIIQDHYQWYTEKPSSFITE